MKKGKRSLTLALSLLTVASLTACNDEYTYPNNKWKDGDIVTVGGQTYTFEQIYKLFDNTKGSAQAYYNVAKNILAQLVTKRTDAILATVDSKINDLKNTWKTNARTNKTSYKEEMEKTFESENVDDIDELRDKYIAAAQNDENSKNFYNINADGATDKSYKYYISEDMTKNYVTKQAPYHVSHILIKVDASSDGEGLWNGKISSDDAKQIGNVARMLASNDSFGSIALIASDDEGSAKQYGELFTSTDGSEQIAMEKTTSYINEFKLGLYAYDAYLNPETKSEDINNSVRASLRVPGKEVTSASYTYKNNTSVKDMISSVRVGNNEAFGIPLSKAFTMGYVSDTEKNMVDNSKVDYTQESQYPRNVLFNNFFNYHGINFMYDDSDEYDASFLKEAKEVAEAAHIDGWSSWTKPSDVQEALPKKYDEYLYVKGQLDRIDENKFQLVDGISDNLVGYVYNEAEQRSEYKKIGAGKKILVEKDDGSKNPVVIVRGGSSSYQGIHFIVVNNDPFVSADKKYEYYRTNIPSASAEKTSAESDSYKDNASFINFVTTDVNSNTTYNTRRDTLYKSIKKADSNIEFNLYESNKAAFKKETGKDFDSLLGDYSKVIEKYISTTRKSSDDSADDSLDESWESYVEKLAIQEDVSPRGIIPQVCISLFEGGSFDGKENLCHVEK